MGIATGEPLVPDERLWIAANKLGVMFPDLPRLGYDLVTWIQEPQEVETERGRVILPRVAVLAVISPHPKDKERQRLTKAAMWYDDWKEEEDKRSHYAAMDDPLIRFFKPLVRAHVKSMLNSEALID